MNQSGEMPAAASSENKSSGSWFLKGMLAGIPICMGYYAVSFALGIAARNTGMNALQSFVMSLTMVASAGQFAAIGLIGAGAGFIEMITTTLIVNLRYFLMSCSLTQKLDPSMKPVHRFGLAYCITDEIFGLSVSVNGYLHPFYTYGITFVSVSGWCAGTVLGVIVGNILPAAAADAMGVAMYGMFLAIIALRDVHRDHYPAREKESLCRRSRRGFDAWQLSVHGSAGSALRFIRLPCNHSDPCPCGRGGLDPADSLRSR